MPFDPVPADAAIQLTDELAAAPSDAPAKREAQEQVRTFVNPAVWEYIAKASGACGSA